MHIREHTQSRILNTLGARPRLRAGNISRPPARAVGEFCLRKGARMLVPDACARNAFLESPPQILVETGFFDGFSSTAPSRFEIFLAHLLQPLGHGAFRALPVR